MPELKEKKTKLRLEPKLPRRERIEPERLPGYNPFTKGGFFSMSFWKHRHNENKKGHKLSVIRMELLNGFFRTFTIIEEDSGFVYDGKKYVLDPEFKYYDLDLKLYCYDFHEGISIPIRRRIPMKRIIDSILASGISEVEQMINPSTLDKYTKSKIVEQILAGMELDEWMKKIKFWVIINTIALVVFLIYIVIKGGALKSIPGMGG